MVQIKIKLSHGDDKLPEWSIIELQGDLEVENGQGLANKFMGDLHFNKDGTPILILGHHTMFGKVIDLDKPIVLLKKNRKTHHLNDPDEVSKNDCDANGVSRMNVDEAPDANGSGTSSFLSTEYLLQAVIRKKILFNKRPRPIVFTNLAKK